MGGKSGALHPRFAAASRGGFSFGDIRVGDIVKCYVRPDLVALLPPSDWGRYYFFSVVVRRKDDVIEGYFGRTMSALRHAVGMGREAGIVLINPPSYTAVRLVERDGGSFCGQCGRTVRAGADCRVCGVPLCDGCGGVCKEHSVGPEKKFAVLHPAVERALGLGKKKHGFEVVVFEIGKPRDIVAQGYFEVLEDADAWAEERLKELGGRYSFAISDSDGSIWSRRLTAGSLLDYSALHPAVRRALLPSRKKHRTENVVCHHCKRIYLFDLLAGAEPPEKCPVCGRPCEVMRGPFEERKYAALHPRVLDAVTGKERIRALLVVFYDEVPEYVTDATDKDITIYADGADHVITMDDIVEFFGPGPTGPVSGMSVLADISGDWRQIRQLADECFRWFAFVNLEGLKRAFSRAGVVVRKFAALHPRVRDALKPNLMDVLRRKGLNLYWVRLDESLGEKQWYTDFTLVAKDLRAAEKKVNEKMNDYYGEPDSHDDDVWKYNTDMGTIYVTVEHIMEISHLQELARGLSWDDDLRKIYDGVEGPARAYSALHPRVREAVLGKGLERAIDLLHSNCLVPAVYTKKDIEDDYDIKMDDAEWRGMVMNFNNADTSFIMDGIKDLIYDLLKNMGKK